MKYRKPIVFFLTLIVATSLFQPVISFAEDPAEHENDHNNTYHEMYYRHEALRPHFHFYYDLLIDRYHPELKSEWREIISERETLIKKFKELKKEGKLQDPPEKDQQWKEKHQEVHEKFLAAVKERNDQEIKEVLPELLTLQKDVNKYLKARIKSE
ncbi:hypothetical protein [Alteribacter populi]|uniref:hypothetical protein n=1 Tax=Alteribacter populi TaxID=2011011 RepID=UPI000BBAB355|nr:hypothetical protein [Alteribacter populi]